MGFDLGISYIASREPLLISAKIFHSFYREMGRFNFDSPRPEQRSGDYRIKKRHQGLYDCHLWVSSHFSFAASAPVGTKGFDFKAKDYCAKGHCYFCSINAKWMIKNRQEKHNPKRRKATTEIISIYVFDKVHFSPIKIRCNHSKHFTQEFNPIGYVKQPMGMGSCIRAKTLSNGGHWTSWVGLSKLNRPMARRTQVMENACQGWYGTMGIRTWMSWVSRFRSDDYSLGNAGEQIL